MNNRGFAITTILYGVLIIFCLLLISMLGILATYKGNLQKLIDANSGARATVQRDSINSNTFTIISGSGTYMGNGIYKFEKSDSDTDKWGGYCLLSTLFNNGKRYRLSYSVQKLTGTFNSIGGHSPAANDVNFYLDSVLQTNPLETNNAYHNVSTIGRANLSDDMNIHNVIFEFTYNNGPEITTSRPGDICIQPNRGIATAVSVNITNLSLTELNA